jgi:hypothetical protein
MRKHHTESKTVRERAAAMILIAACLVFGSTSLFAQAAANDRGFYCGLSFIGSSLNVEDTGEEIFSIKDDGGGAQLQFGYHFNPVFALELDLGGANHDTTDPKISADFGLVQLFAVYRFVPEKQFRPYIKGGFGGYGLKLEGHGVDVTVSGGGLAFGAGFGYFFSPHFSLGVDFTHNIIRYDSVELRLEDVVIGTEIDEEGSQSSLGLAFAYHF